MVCEYTRVPEAFDYVSTDNYLPYGEYNSARMFYKKFLYPKMHPHQHVWIIPPVYNNSGSCPGQTGSIAALDACILNQTIQYLRWADDDLRVTGIDGFHFGTYGRTDIGLESLPHSLECYRTLGDQLVAH